MFTGIVSDRFPIASIERKPGLMHLVIELGNAMTQDLTIGASVSVSGVCLTVVHVEEGRARFDVIAETIARTSLGALNPGDAVNIERAARFGDEIGGHDVSGHINSTGTIVAIDTPTNNWIITIKVGADEMKYIFHKGFIALDGASLTIASVDRSAQTFQVHLIPETLARTTFGTRKVGDRINVEVDPRTVAIVDTIDSVLDQKLSDAIKEQLR